MAPHQPGTFVRRMKIAIVGAESTGKSQLANLLANELRRQGQCVFLVNEYLREWCDHHGRTPRADEQAEIAREQVHRVDAAGASAISKPGTASHVIVADSTPLVTAIYSDLLFGDRSLYNLALTHQRGYDLTLMTGLDLPWVADGLQRDGERTREAVDSLLRAALDRGSLGYQVVYGAGPARLTNALRAIISIATYAYGTRATARITSETLEKKEIWTWPCDKCSDPDCEHRLFSQLLR